MFQQPSSATALNFTGIKTMSINRNFQKHQRLHKDNSQSREKCTWGWKVLLQAQGVRILLQYKGFQLHWHVPRENPTKYNKKYPRY